MNKDSNPNLSPSFESLEVKPVAIVHTDFPEKFGIPRQADIIKDLKGTIVLTPDYQKPGVFHGLSQYSHLWLIWGFTLSKPGWSPTVRPPRLGGNVRMGVFATRSPFRPNPLGLSAVRIEEIDEDNYSIRIRGVDLVDGTPVYDIKPYIPYSDSIPDAEEGMAALPRPRLTVEIPDNLKEKIPADVLSTLTLILAQDPRPAYQQDESRIYGLKYAGMNVRFTVRADQVLHVVSIDFY